MDPITLGALGISGISALWNAYQSYKNNQYQKKVQQETWKREDTAQQRSVEDLMRAGLSPTLAAGHPAPTSSPIKPETPKAEAMAALALLQMKADISKTSAEARTQNVLADVNEASRKYLELMNVEKYYNLMNTRALTAQKIGTETARGTLLYQQGLSAKHNLERSRHFGIRTNDSNKIIVPMMMGDQGINNVLDIIEKMKGVDE